MTHDVGSFFQNVLIILWLLSDIYIGQCTVQNIQLVVYPVIIPIHTTMKLRYPALIIVLRPDCRGVLVMCLHIKYDAAKQ